MCNVPIQLRTDVIAAYLTEYRHVEDVIKAKSTSGTAHGDHYFTMWQNRTGFQSIPHTIEYENQMMMVVVEGRKPQCWNSKQLGHFSRTCPQTTTNPISSTSTTTTTAITISTDEDLKTDNPNKEEGWTQVVRGNKKMSPLKTQNQKKKKNTRRKTAKQNIYRQHRYYCYYNCPKRKIIIINSNNKSTTR